MSTLSLSLSPFSPFHLFLAVAAKQKCRLEKRGARAVVAYRDLPNKYIKEINDYKMHHDEGRNVAKSAKFFLSLQMGHFPTFSISSTFASSIPLLLLRLLSRNGKFLTCSSRPPSHIFQAKKSPFYNISSSSLLESPLNLQLFQVPNPKYHHLH